MKKGLLISVLLLPCLPGCTYTTYEYIHNKSGQDITVQIRPALPDSIERVRANNFANQGVAYTASKENNTGTYVLKNKGWLRVGIAYDALGKEDFGFDYMQVVRGPGDTLDYEGKSDIMNAFKKQNFTKYSFVKPERKGEKKPENEKTGGWLFIVKKPAAKA